jgi:uncharacterized YkwD family protein/spore coat assembly protein SafA
MRKILVIALLTFWIPLQFGHAQGTDTYTVKPGDTLWKIAMKYQIGVHEIISSNPQFKNPDLIYPGDKVNVPNIDQTKNIEQEVLSLVNKERQAQGIQPLQMDWELQRVARKKSCDMRDKGYFSHQSPTYGSPFEMMKQFGIEYRTAGENIAKGQQSAEAVMEGWMNSPGHRKNILKAEFTHIGVGFCEGNYWTQQFIGK